jgi:asparagine synthase (glutamine-hydrolysing)
MPGIVGFVTKMPRAQAEPQLLRMVDSIRHEPSYRTATWIDESAGVYVGWSVRKDSFADGMPLSNPQGSVVLIFSGEEYPDPESARKFNSKNGHSGVQGPFYLVGMYEEGTSFPTALNGRFHGILVDRNQGTTTLFNDRYGIHRLYCHESKEGFYFAAEAKAILAVRSELRVVDSRSLGELVSCGCVMENRTIFQNIFVLPPASAWTFRNSFIDKRASYFEPSEWENQEPLDGESYYQALRQAFSQNLPRYFNSREKIGVSLTGGLDTRMIMAWHRAPANSLPCYTFGGMFRDSHDVRVARKIARACEQPFEIIPVGSEFLSNFSHYAERAVYLSDGCAGVRHAADLYVNERVAKIASVRMTGNYGSEVLRRLPAFKPVVPPSDLFSHDFLANVQAARSTYARVIQGHAVSFIAFRQVPWHHYGLLGLEQTQVSLRSPFLDNDVVRTAFRAPGSSAPKYDVFEDSDDCVRLIQDGNAGLRQIRTDRGLAGPPGRLSAAMSRGLLEFTFKAEYAYDYGMPQWVAAIDHGLSPLHLERLFLGRHKFLHFRVWYRDALASYVRDMLLDSRSLSRPYLNRSGVESLVQGHLKGNHNYTTQIHQLLTLELLHRLFLDAQ